jgi:DNA-binding GntR family transcriptional regulator
LSFNVKLPKVPTFRRAQTSRRSDAADNYDAIREACITLSSEGKKLKIQAIAQQTGLSRKTVSKHIRTGELS